MPHLSKRADQIVKLAKEIALTYGQGYVGTEHLLLAILREGGGQGAQVLALSGATVQKVKEEIDRQIRERMQETWVMGRLPGTPHFKDVLARADQEARGRGNWQVCSIHLLMALMSEKGSVGYKTLAALGITPELIRRATAPQLATP